MWTMCKNENNVKISCVVFMVNILRLVIYFLSSPVPDHCWEDNSMSVMQFLSPCHITAHFFQHPQNILFIPKAHIHFLIKSWQLHCHLWKQSMVLCETVSGHIKTIWSSAFVLYLWVLLVFFVFVFVFVFLFVCLFILKQFNQVCLESIIKDKW